MKANHIKIACRRTKIGALSIPHFTFTNGDLLCLHWPLPGGTETETNFIDILTGKRKQPAIEVFEPVVYVEVPAIKTFLWSWIPKKTTVKDYLIKKRLLSASDVGAFLKQLDLSDEIKLSDLSLTHRTLLSIEASWLISNGILFTTAGLDPLGQNQIYEAIAQKLPFGYSAIHLSYPTVPSRVCYVKAKCIEWPLRESPSQ